MLLEFCDPEGIPHRMPIPAAWLGGRGEELRAFLMSRGLQIATDARRQSLFLSVLARCNPRRFARCVPSAGWHGDCYVTPAAVYGDTGGEEIVLQSASAEVANLTQRGTLAEWKSKVSAPCVGNSRLILAMCAAFAGPTLGLVEAESGGLHLRGRSSSGKSTALQIAASAYGPPEYARTWRATDSALEGVAALHSDALLILDEIAQLDPKLAGAAAYLLANGAGRARAARDGSARPVSRFRVLFLSAGEIALADMVIDLPADAGGDYGGIFESVPGGLTPGQFADHLRRSARAHHGHAIPAWVDSLAATVRASRALLTTLRDRIRDSLAGANADGQVRRVAARFALLAAAGEMASDRGFTGWPPGEAERAVSKCFTAWLSARGTSGAAEPAAMVGQVREFISRHGDARFQVWSEYTRDHRPRVINRAGWRKDPTDGGLRWFIESEVFRSEVSVGFDPVQVARALDSIGALRRGGAGELTRNERLPDGRKARCYVITPALFGDQNAPTETEDAAA
jgi:putative DNA primase/helicase